MSIPEGDLEFVQSFRSEKSQNESFPNFSNFRPEFCPEFCSEISPNFSRTFRASFRGRRRPEKIHQKSPPFFNAKFPGKHEKNIHKILLESRQSNNLWALRGRQNTGFGVPLKFEKKKSQDAQPPLTPRHCLDYRGRVPDASP